MPFPYDAAPWNAANTIDFTHTIPRRAFFQHEERGRLRQGRVLPAQLPLERVNALRVRRARGAAPDLVQGRLRGRLPRHELGLVQPFTPEERTALALAQPPGGDDHAEPLRTAPCLLLFRRGGHALDGTRFPEPSREERLADPYFLGERIGTDGGGTDQPTEHTALERRTVLWHATTHL